MLYIKFKIQDSSKFSDFQKLYSHMKNVRQPDYILYEEVDPDSFDWDNMTDEEMQDAFKKMDDSRDSEKQDLKRYKQHIPNYVNDFFEKYLHNDNHKLGALGIHNVLSIFNYLEFSFEVEMDKLEKLNNESGIVNFSTGNYPFGGLDRFFITLKAFDLIPNECFNGFSIVEINWNSDLDFETIELPEKTQSYLAKFKK